MELSKHRESVLLISTDPAHNLSDAFGQKFNNEPTLVKGFTNLFGMEIDTDFSDTNLFGGDDADAAGMSGMLKELTSSIPGIDEAVGFSQLLKTVDSMQHSCIVFDTAPTGHTLRLLQCPFNFEKIIGVFEGFKNKMGPMMGSVSQLMEGMGGMPEGAGGFDLNKLDEQLQSMKAATKRVQEQFADANRTTFVCVCIPEFLSLYETERLVQELTKIGIDVHNVVVNQLVFLSEQHPCPTCEARVRIQGKYLSQIFDLYEDFHVVRMPLLLNEVRGPEALKSFASLLMNPVADSYVNRSYN